MRNRKLVTLALSATALGGAVLAAPAAVAADANFTAVVALPGTDGSRSITAATVAGGVLVNGVPSVLTVAVTESAKRGTAEWSVTATGADLTGDQTPAVTLPASSLAMGAATAPSATGCLSVALLTSRCTVGAGAGGNLASAQSVFSVTGQRTDVSYTGVYTGTAPVTLTVPEGTPAGTYSGKVVVTLVQ